MIQKLTRVGWYFSATHRKANGTPHGHTWEVWATFPAGECAEALQSRLRGVLLRFHEKLIPDELTRAEDMAEVIGEELDGCVEVELTRPLERLGGAWRR